MCGESRTHGVNRGKSWKHWKRQAYLSELAESAKAENRPNDVRYQYIIIGNDLLFVIKSQYQMVRRRIEDRLLRNLKRNVGLRCELSGGVFGELPVTGFLKMQKKYERGDVQ